MNLMNEQEMWDRKVQFERKSRSFEIDSYMNSLVKIKRK